MPATKDTTTVRITRAAHEKLRAMADEDDVSLTEELDRLVEEQRRARFFEEADAAYARLRADDEAWAEYQAEIKAWDATLMDGIEDEPPYYDEEEEDGS